LSIKVLLADDHALVRAGINALLQQMENVEVVAQAENGKQALSLILQHEPDVALLDISMPEMSGLEVTKYLSQEKPKIRIIILSMHNDEEYVAEALCSGAAGYLLKGSSPVELQLSINSVFQGGIYLSPNVSEYVVSGYVERIENNATSNDNLTPRQREILHLIAKGKTTKEIGLKLNISVKTVEAHRANLMERLGIYDLAGLIRYAIRNGIVSSEE